MAVNNDRKVNKESRERLLDELNPGSVVLGDLEDLNREQREKIEPIEDALEYVSEALESEDMYFDPIHAARLRNGEDSTPIDEMVSKDVRSFPDLEEKFEDLLERSDDQAITYRNSLLLKNRDLRDHLEKSDLIGSVFDVDGNEFDVNDHIESLENGDNKPDWRLLKRVEMLFESNLEYSEAGLNDEIHWKHQAFNLINAFANLQGSLDFKLSESSQISFNGVLDDEGLPPADGVLMFLDNLGFEEFDDCYLPSQPYDLGHEIYDNLEEQYSRALKSINNGSSQTQDNLEIVESESFKVDWKSFEDEYGSVPEEEMREFYEAAATYQVEDRNIDSDLIMKITADINGQNVSYNPDEKALTDNFGDLKKAVGETDNLDYQLPGKSKEREAYIIAETIDTVEKFCQQQNYQTKREN